MSPAQAGAAADAQEVRLAGSFDELKAIAGAWPLDETGVDFYSTWTWFENLSRSGVEPELTRLLLLVRQRASGRWFCLPLLARPRAPAAAYGAATTSLSNYYSSLFGPIGDAGAVSLEALRAAIAHLKQRHRASAVIDMQPMDTTAPFYALLRRALQAEGYRVDSYFCFGNWHLEVAGRSFADYETSVPSRLRNTYRRGRKKLDASGPWSLQVHAALGPELEAAIADFEAIYAKSWKSMEPFPDFVPGLCRAAAARGWLRLGVIRAENAPIAAQLWLVKDRHALIYKLAFDEEFKRFSAGSVLSADMMRRAIDEDGVVDVNYLTGDDGYKVDWMSHRRERRGLVAFRPLHPQGLLSLVKHKLGRLRRKPAPAAPASAPAETAYPPPR